jgi:hypothetical protein
MPGPRALGAVSANVPAISGSFPINENADLARAIVLTEQGGSVGTAYLLRALASGRIALLPLLPDKLAVTQPYLQRRVEHLHVLSQLWEKESRAGPRCFVGRFEGCGILVSPRRNDSDPTAPRPVHPRPVNPTEIHGRARSAYLGHGPDN